MSDSEKNKAQEAGDEVLKRMLKTPLGAAFVKYIIRDLTPETSSPALAPDEAKAETRKGRAESSKPGNN